MVARSVMLHLRSYEGDRKTALAIPGSRALTLHKIAKTPGNRFFYLAIYGCRYQPIAHVTLAAMAGFKMLSGTATQSRCQARFPGLCSTSDHRNVIGK